MSQQQHDLYLRSSAFPAATLLDSYYDRDVTRLSDRGLASNLIGDRWSEVSSDTISSWSGQQVFLPNGERISVTQVFRLDDIPEIARIASRRKLQNPDFLISGNIDSEVVLLAIDAKFSIETAKPAQVSAETTTALLEVGHLITDLLPGLPTDVSIRDGLFISPDVPLTHYVLGRSRGRLAARVAAAQVVLNPIGPVPFLKPLQGARLIGTLANCDGYRQEIRSNMLLAMYYFRLARACYGAYAEITSPIFGPPSAAVGSAEELEARTATMARTANSAWDLVLAWDAMADQIRRQREAVFNAMPFPMPNKDLRERVVAESELRGLEAPSINSVRKRLGSWYRHQFDEQLGVILPPVQDLAGLIQRIQSIATEVAPLVPDALNEVIEDVFSQQPPMVTSESETV